MVDERSRDTWAGAELAFRGRGPPPVPRRMSFVAAPGAALARGSDAVSAIALARNARRLMIGNCGSIRRTRRSYSDRAL